METAKATVARVLTIAGSDSGGGAGIQADLKTCTALGVYGMSAVTAVTAQNTLGITASLVLQPAIVVEQIRLVMDDIGADAVKTGMLGDSRVARAVAGCLAEYRPSNLVVDPVLSSKSGVALLDRDGLEVLVRELLPLTRVFTPNLQEAGVILGRTIRDLEEVEAAARELQALGPQWVVVKGGHLPGEAVDLVCSSKSCYCLTAQRQPTSNTHGTGCTFSAAVAAGLAMGLEVLPALQLAKDFINWAIGHAFDLGHGYGPTNHFYFQRLEGKES